MSLRRWVPTTPTLHTVQELSAAALWLLQHEEYYRVGYVLLEYVTRTAIERLPEAERKAMYARLEAGGLDAEVRSVTPLKLLATLSQMKGGQRSMLDALTTSLWGTNHHQASLFSMAEEAMGLWAGGGHAADDLGAHAEAGLMAYLNRARGEIAHAATTMAAAASDVAGVRRA